MRLQSLPRIAAVARACVTPVAAGVLLILGGSILCSAAELTVTVTDRAGRPVADVVVTAMPTIPFPVAVTAASSAVMDQRELQFAPLVLAVAVGTSVEFPNNDSVSHQVYSFSSSKKFQLPLYKGARHPPVIFDKAGLVVLGCNIHDDMVGYIYVVDAPYFGTTDASGSLHLENMRAGDFTLRIWSPFITDVGELLHREVRANARQPISIDFRLGRDLRARPEPRAKRGNWEY